MIECGNGWGCIRCPQGVRRMAPSKLPMYSTIPFYTHYKMAIFQEGI